MTDLQFKYYLETQHEILSALKDLLYEVYEIQRKVETLHNEIKIPLGDTPQTFGEALTKKEGPNEV